MVAERDPQMASGILFSNCPTSVQINNRERIGRALEHLRQGLLQVINSRMTAREKTDWIASGRHPRTSAEFDVKDCLEILNRFWEERFSNPRLGRGGRAWVNELIEIRNQYTTAHQRTDEDVSLEDTWRALDTAERLLAGIGSSQAESVESPRRRLSPASRKSARPN